MGSLMINVDESSFNIWQNFNLVLQLLTDVVCLPKRGIRVHNNVDFYVIFLNFMLKKPLCCIVHDIRTGPLCQVNELVRYARK